MESVADRVEKLKRDLNAVVLAHNYCAAEVQDLADFVGDSLGLAVEASKTDADVVVFCGVSFMAETAKILNPGKKVLMAEPVACCVMAQMCTAEQIVEARRRHPGAAVVGYVNTTAACKAELDVCCTSSNAVDVVSSLAEDDVIFLPDRNLGSYVASRCSGKNVILWNGFCPMHHFITVSQAEELKRKHPGAPVFAHPECRAEVLAAADEVGSTERILNLSKETDAENVIILTEVGMKHRLERECPGKRFHFVDSVVCSAMKTVDAGSIVRTMETLSNEVVLDADVMRRAYEPLRRMTEMLPRKK